MPISGRFASKAQQRLLLLGLCCLLNIGKEASLGGACVEVMAFDWCSTFW